MHIMVLAEMHNAAKKLYSLKASPAPPVVGSFGFFGEWKSTKISGLTIVRGWKKRVKGGYCYSIFFSPLFFTVFRLFNDKRDIHSTATQGIYFIVRYVITQCHLSATAELNRPALKNLPSS